MDQRTEFNVVLPLVKAKKGPDGQTWVHGVASDETLDLQREVTLAAGLKRSLPYLRKFGKFNDDHRRVNVGETLVADVLPNAELVKAGVLNASDVPARAMQDEVLYVAGTLYPHVKRARYYRDVLRSGGRLGLSIQGAILQKDVQKSNIGAPVTVNRECFINKIAITDQPVNTSTWVALKKSFGGGKAPGLVQAIAKGLQKALTTGAGIVMEGDTGGPALRKQSLEGAKRKKRKRSKKEGLRMNDHEFTCHVTDVKKSFGGMSADDVRSRIQSALNPAADGGAPVAEPGGWVQALYEDRAIVCRKSKYFNYPFTIKGGELKLGEPTEVVADWKPVGKAAKSILDGIGLLDSPQRIVKAWNTLADPVFVGEAGTDEVRAAKLAVRDAAKERGLSYAIDQDRKSPDSSDICKSLSEADIGTLMRLESTPDEEFTALVDSEVEALEKSRGKKAEPPADEDEEGKKPAADSDEEEEEDEDLDLGDGEEEEEEDEDLDLGDEEEEEEEKPTRKGKARKSVLDLLSEEDDVGEAFDAAPALKTQAKIISKALDGMQSAVESMPKELAELVTAGLVEGLTKGLEPLVGTVEEMAKSLEGLKGDVDELGKRPSPAGSYRVLQKGFDGGESEFTRQEALDVLTDAAEAHLVDARVVTKFEVDPNSVEPALVKSLAAKLGRDGGKKAAA